jgi:hypothetical protein
MKTKYLYREIDALLEAMWQRSPERKGLQVGRRTYNYARSMFIRARRERVEHAAYAPLAQEGARE